MRRAALALILLALLVTAIILAGRGDDSAPPAKPEVPDVAQEQIPAPLPSEPNGESPDPEKPPSVAPESAEESPSPPAKTTLRVLSADGGADLTDIRVVRVRNWRKEDQHHPGEVVPGQIWLEGETSPVVLPPGDGRFPTHTIFVTSPGYAWGRIQIDLQAGGERIIQLKRGGGVEIELTGGEAPKGAAVRLWRGPVRSGRPSVEIDVRHRHRIEIEALPAGLYFVGVEVGNWWDDPLTLAKGEVTVAAAATAEVTLEIEEVEKPEFVPLAGVIVVPEEWEVHLPSVALKLLDTPLGGQKTRLNLGTKPVEGSPGVSTFDAGMMQPGRYELIVGRIEYSVSFRLGETGDRNIRVEVPIPGTVIVRVVDASTGQDAEGVELVWNYRRPEWVSGGGLEGVKRDPKTKRFTIRAPLGEIQISVHGESWEWTAETVEVGAAPREVTLSARRGVEIRIIVKEGAATVPWDWDWKLDVTALDGEGRASSWGAGDGSSHFVRVSHPGRYRVVLRPIKGYEKVPPQEVTVEVGKEARIVFQLVRAR